MREVGGDFLKRSVRRSKIKRNVEFIIIYILFAVGIVAFIYFNNFRKESCINKGGQVIENVIGIYDKCIYGSDKE